VADRPEFRVLEAAIRDADAEVTLAQAYTKPSYGVGVRYQREGPDHIVLGGLTIALPVFSKGQELAATGRARSARLRAELESARVRARIELQTAIDAYERRVSAVRTLATEAVPGIEEVAALTTRSFDVGQIGLKDVLVIRRELLDSRMLALSAQLEVARARVTLEATAGVLR
jgi:cobalt-zinc-cadmium efflux system outer membrane protein